VRDIHRLAGMASSRTDADISQEFLAERADIDRTYLSLVERGLRQPTIWDAS